MPRKKNPTTQRAAVDAVLGLVASGQQQGLVQGILDRQANEAEAKAKAELRAESLRLAKELNPELRGAELRDEARHMLLFLNGDSAGDISVIDQLRAMVEKAGVAVVVASLAEVALAHGTVVHSEPTADTGAN